MHEPHRQRIARQEHELHHAVAAALGEIPVARYVDIVAAVEALPELKILRKAPPSPEGGKEDVNENLEQQAVYEQPYEDGRAYPGGLREGRGRGAEFPAGPEAHPARHKAQADQGEEHGAQRRGQAGQEAVPGIPEPEDIGQAQRREAEKADDEPGQGIFSQE